MFISNKNFPAAHVIRRPYSHLYQEYGLSSIIYFFPISNKKHLAHDYAPAYDIGDSRNNFAVNKYMG